jgi:hypothetical protein
MQFPGFPVRRDAFFRTGVPARKLLSFDRRDGSEILWLSGANLA